MLFSYEAPNMIPKLGTVNGDKQAVSVYDRNLGNHRTIITTVDEADEFIKERKDAIDSAAKKGWIGAALATAASSIVGAGINSHIESVKANNLNAVLEALNTALEEGLTKSDFIAPFDVSKMYSEELKRYELKDVSAIAKKACKSGAIYGAGLAACFAFAIPFIKASRADKKITQEFIENNK